MKPIQVTYSNFLSLVSSKGLNIQFEDNGGTYLVFAVENGISWDTILIKGSLDSNDFETNHKPTANQIIETRVRQSVHDQLNLNANIQVGDVDNSPANPLFVTSIAGSESPLPSIHRAVVADIAYTVDVQSFNLGSSGTETPVLLITNGGGNTVTLYLHTLGANNEVKTQSAKIIIYENPTITVNGVVETPDNLLVGSPTASVMSVFSVPTISANGNSLFVFATGSNQNDLRRNFEFGLALPPGNSMLITGAGSNNNTLVDFVVEWAEI